jgi:hypothetical protein
MKSMVTEKNMMLVAGADGSVSVEPGSRDRKARAKYRRAARSETIPAGAPRRVVNVRGWPGLDGWRPPSPPRPFHDRLWQRNGLYLFAAAAVSGAQEAFVLGGALLAAGPSIVEGALLVPDDFEDRDPAGLEAIRVWAKDNPLPTTLGPRPWQVLTLSRFFDPKASTDCGHLAFAPNAYTGRTFVLGADFGRFFGLAAEHFGARRGKASGMWEVWLPGWGIEREDGWRRASPHRPSIRLKARRVGWQVDFGPCEKGCGKYVDGRLWRGAFVDLLSLAYSLDGDRGAGFGDHRRNVGLPAFEMPLQVPMNTTGAAQVAAAIRAMHETALALDEKAGDWFTTADDRAEGNGRIDLARTISPGALAAAIVGRFGVEAPIAKLKLTDAELAAWAESFHGGWCSGDERLFGLLLGCVLSDLSSAFPMCASLLGWWRLVTATSVRPQDMTGVLRAVCERAIADPTVVLNPAVWRQLGFTLVETVPDGEPWPIEIEDERRPDGRMEVVPVFSPDRRMFFAWPDVVAAAVVSGRVPTILRATKLVPVGRQTGLRRQLPVLPGLVLGIDDDPAVTLVRHRHKVKEKDPVLGAELRVIVNALVFGIFGRGDEIRQGSDIGERPGPWSFLPIASSVTAGARLLLAVVNRLVADRGGIVAYRDTDSSVILSSPEGGSIDLADGSSARQLSWAEVGDLLALFAPLGVFGEDIPVWKTERGSSEQPLHSIVYRAKRHVQCTLGTAGPEIEDWTEANLGGTYADPPAMAGRSEDGKGRAWSFAAVRREVDYSLARVCDPLHAVRSEAPWDAGQALAFPAFRLLSVVSPEVLDSLPRSLGARPGTAFVQASRDNLYGGEDQGAVVAIDPGDDLAGWWDLAWFDLRTGARVHVTTDRRDIDAVVLATLDEKAIAWSIAPKHEPIKEVWVVPALVRHVGRVSGVLDADIDGLAGDLRDRRPVHDDGARLQAVIDYAQALGKRAFSRRTGLKASVAGRAAEGERISKANVHKALRALRVDDGSPRRCAAEPCKRPVFRLGAIYCSPRCKATSRKRRQRERANETSREEAAS